MSGIIAQNTLDNSGLIKSPAGGGAWNFISKLTASGSGDLSFTSGIDSTYKEYLFTFNNIHPAIDNTDLSFQGNVVGGSGYNETMTTTYFRAQHDEGDTNASMQYEASYDQAQGTSFQILSQGVGNDNDQSCSGYLHLFAPSDTTFIKHYISRFHNAHNNDFAMSGLSAGYFNTTAAIDEIQFKMSSGNIDAGDICLYGLTT